MNQLIIIPPNKARIADRNIRIHMPMPLSNPFQASERITREEAVIAYDAWLRNRLTSGDKLITAEMERIIKYVTDSTGQPVGLIGNEQDGEVIKRIIEEVVNEK